MIIEILELAAALEWIALGVLVFFKLRSLKRQTEVTLEALTSRSSDCLLLNSSRSACVWKRGFRGLLVFLSAPSDTV